MRERERERETFLLYFGVKKKRFLVVRKPLSLPLFLLYIYIYRIVVI